MFRHTLGDVDFVVGHDTAKQVEQPPAMPWWSSGSPTRSCLTPDGWRTPIRRGPRRTGRWRWGARGRPSRS